MEYLQGLFVALIILDGLIGGYYMVLLMSHLKEAKPSNIFFGAWIIDPKQLTVEGRGYRQKIFYCWIIALVLIVGIKLI